MPVINNSTIPISYREIDVTIPANGQVTLQQPYDHISLLSSDVPASQLKFRFGSLSMETQLSAGLGWSLDYTFASVTIRNIGSAAANIRLSLAEGNVSDNRLTVTGIVNTQTVPYGSATCTLETFPAGGKITVDSSSYKNVVIQNNSSTDSIFIFSNNTFEVLPNGTFEKDFAGSFDVYGTAGETISLGLFK